MLVLSACGGGGGSSPPPVANVTVTPTMASVMVGQQLQVGATTTDAMGNPFAAPISWASSNPSIATVSATGVVLALDLGKVTITATSEGKSATALVTSTTGINFIFVSAGGSHTCALAPPDGVAYCWGDNSSGQLGNGTTANSATPVPVAGGIRFAHLSAGGGHTCGTTQYGIAYCWGDNSSGQLGNGTTVNSATPVLVAGGLTLVAVSAGGRHSCGIAFMTFAVYCWGSNDSGQLGNGTLTGSSVPVTALSELLWNELSAGDNHTCAVATMGDIPLITPSTILTTYCWGDNSFGQLGNGTLSNSVTAVAVQLASGVSEQTISAGTSFSCRVGNNRGYCWGNNDAGELGDGTMTSSATPVPILGFFFGARISAGARHACGVVETFPNGNVSSAGYCWGDDTYGQLGNGTTASSAIPAAIAGGLNFSPALASVSAGGHHSCGVASPSISASTDTAAYCWGDNTFGQLGNSWTTSSSVPVNVVGPQ